ncbi:L-fuculokinase [Actinomycetota bacterium]
MYLLGLDVGSTGCKVIVFDPDGKIINSGFEEYGIILDQYGKAEQDAENIWKIICCTIRKVAEDVNSSRICALGLSVQGDGIIPVDKNFKALHNAILGMDYRSKPQVEIFENQFNPREVFKLTGMRPHPMNSLSKLLWFRENHPSIYKKTFKITTYADFILGKFGADPSIDYTMATRTMAFDLSSNKWSEKILNKLDLNKNIFSVAKPSGVVVGRIKATLSEKLGLDKNMLLVTGGHDQACAALGAGITNKGSGVISTGTAEVLSTVFTEPITNDTMFNSFYPCYRYVKDGMYFTFSLNHVGGLLLRWYRENFSDTEILKSQGKNIDKYQMMIDKIPPGPSNIMFLPHMNGSGTPWCDMDSKGAIIGLTMSSTRHDIVRAILESQSYELKINIDTLEKAGIKINRFIAVGGGSRSATWLQIKSNVLNKTIYTLKNKEAACLGAAILAGYGAGIYNSIEDGVKRTVKTDRTFHPEKNNMEKYKKRFATYTKIYPALKNINQELG